MKKIYAIINGWLNHCYYILSRQAKSMKFLSWGDSENWLYVGRALMSVLLANLCSFIVLVCLYVSGFNTPYTDQTLAAITTWVGILFFTFKYKESLYYELEVKYVEESHLGMKSLIIILISCMLFYVSYRLAEKTGMYWGGRVSAIHKYTRLFTFH